MTQGQQAPSEGQGAEGTPATPFDRYFLLTTIKTRAEAWRLYAEAQFLGELVKTGKIETVEDLEGLVDYAKGWKVGGRRLPDFLQRVLDASVAAGSVDQLAGQINFVGGFHIDGDALYEHAQHFQEREREFFQSVYSKSGIRFTRALCASCKQTDLIPLRTGAPCLNCGKPLTVEALEVVQV